ncbi:diacylglycerol kinase, partial [Enterococcus lactis]|nr:diacylglycerol kinase [Enterococcus lactis]
YDEGEYIGNASMFFLGLTNSVGGFEQIAPDAKLDDGKFSLIIVKTANIFEILHIAALMLNGGRHVDDPRVIYTKTSSLFVETEDDINRPVMINLDGEYGGEAPMHFQNLHQHIEFFANTDQIPDEAITGTDEEELEVVSKEFVKEVERLTDEDIDGDGKIADETPNQKN